MYLRMYSDILPAEPILSFFENIIDPYKKASDENKKEDKDQESIQSSTIPDPEHHMGKVTKIHKTQQAKKPRGQPLPSR